MIYLFMIPGISLWYLNMYDYEKLSKEFELVKNRIIENNYEFYVSKVNDKGLNKNLKDRIVYSLFILILVLMISDTNIILSLICFVLSYKANYYFMKNKYFKLVKKTNAMFPYYLNNLAILVHQNAVLIALNKSIELAPHIFKDDLKELVKQAHNESTSIDPYLKFAKKFENIDDITRVMRTLYNLGFKASNRDIMITSLSKITNEKLANQIKIDYKKELDKQQLWPYYLFLWLGLLIVQMIMMISIF